MMCVIWSMLLLTKLYITMDSNCYYVYLEIYFKPLKKLMFKLQLDEPIDFLLKQFYIY